jgi:hypothetical protein
MEKRKSENTLNYVHIILAILAGICLVGLASLGPLNAKIFATAEKGDAKGTVSVENPEGEIILITAFAIVIVVIGVLFAYAKYVKSNRKKGGKTKITKAK